MGIEMVSGSIFTTVLFVNVSSMIMFSIVNKVQYSKISKDQNFTSLSSLTNNIILIVVQLLLSILFVLLASMVNIELWQISAEYVAQTSTTSSVNVINSMEYNLFYILMTPFGFIDSFIVSLDPAVTGNQEFDVEMVNYIGSANLIVSSAFVPAFFVASSMMTKKSGNPILEKAIYLFLAALILVFGDVANLLGIALVAMPIAILLFIPLQIIGALLITIFGSFETIRVISGNVEAIEAAPILMEIGDVPYNEFFGNESMFTLFNSYTLSNDINAAALTMTDILLLIITAGLVAIIVGIIAFYAGTRIII